MLFILAPAALIFFIVFNFGPPKRGIFGPTCPRENGRHLWHRTLDETLGASLAPKPVSHLGEKTGTQTMPGPWPPLNALPRIYQPWQPHSRVGPNWEEQRASRIGLGMLWMLFKNGHKSDNFDFPIAITNNCHRRLNLAI